MSYLTSQEKLNFILDLCEKHHITGYEIGENTPLNASGVHRILTGEVQNPRPKTLDIILEYIQQKIVGKDLKKDQKNSVKEPEIDYRKNIQEIITERIMEEIRPIFQTLKKEHYEIMSAQLEINRALDEMRDLVQELNKNSEEIHEQVVPKK